MNAPYISLFTLIVIAQLFANEILNTTYLFAESNSFRKLTVLHEDSTYAFIFYKDDLKLIEYTLDKYEIDFPAQPLPNFPRPVHTEKPHRFSETRYYYDLEKLYSEDSTLTITSLMTEIDSTIVFSLEPDKTTHYDELARLEKNQTALERLKRDYKAFTADQ